MAYNPPIGRKNTTYIPLIVLAFWGVICYLPPFRGTRYNHWSEQEIVKVPKRFCSKSVSIGNFETVQMGLKNLYTPEILTWIPRGAMFERKYLFQGPWFSVSICSISNNCNHFPSGPYVFPSPETNQDHDVSWIFSTKLWRRNFMLKKRWALEKSNSFRLEIFNSFNFRGKKTMFPNIQVSNGGFLLTACVVEFCPDLHFPMEFRVCGEMNCDQNKRQIRIIVLQAANSCVAKKTKQYYFLL